jgi:hypothetical protein
LLLLGGVLHQLHLTNTQHEKARNTAHVLADIHTYGA